MIYPAQIGFIPKWFLEFKDDLPIFTPVYLAQPSISCREKKGKKLGSMRKDTNEKPGEDLFV